MQNIALKAFVKMCAHGFGISIIEAIVYRRERQKAREGCSAMRRPKMSLHRAGIRKYHRIGTARPSSRRHEVRWHRRAFEIGIRLSLARNA